LLWIITKFSLKNFNSVVILELNSSLETLIKSKKSNSSLGIFAIFNSQRNWGGSKSGIQEQYVISVELHIDCLMIGNVLTSNNKGSPCGRSLVVKICCLLEMEREVAVHHSYSKANQCVDTLANLASLWAMLLFIMSLSDSYWSFGSCWCKGSL